MEAEGPTYPLFSIFHFLKLKGGYLGIPRIDDGIPVYLEKETQIRVKRSIEYLKSIDFFTNGGKAGSAAPVFKRSGLKKKTSS